MNTDTAQAFALHLNRAIAGYSAKLDLTGDVVVMGLDSATPGRMAITFYRELKGSEFIQRIKAWHQQCAWPQNFGDDKNFVGAPAPRDIAEATHGDKLEGDNGKKLAKASIERLLPCIIDGRQIPEDLVLSARHRATNRLGFERNIKKRNERAWEKCLGIACALFKGFHTERSYQMSLEQNRISRDYLYGRLLAIAESIESYALFLSDETRDTNAARLMQRFADRPCSTWRTIELGLTPYKSRLGSSEKSAAFLRKRNKLLDEVVGSFQSDDFINDSALSGEFLLGYHCQRQALRPNSVEPADNNSDTND
jgi:CRISPR-associated protein Csd1